MYYTTKIYPQEVTCCIHFALNPRVSVSDATVTQEYCCSWKDKTDQKEEINIGYNAKFNISNACRVI